MRHRLRGRPAQAAIPIADLHPERLPLHHTPGCMVNVCYNSECRKELHYLREGRVVRIIHGEGDQAQLEHFWLCGPCSRAFEFVFQQDGSVSLRHRHDARPATTAA